MSKHRDRAYLVKEGLVPVFGRLENGQFCVYWHKKQHCVREADGLWIRKIDFALKHLGGKEVSRRLKEAQICADSFFQTAELGEIIKKYNALLDLLVEAARLKVGAAAEWQPNESTEQTETDD